jgi:hypothetical protein
MSRPIYTAIGIVLLFIGVAIGYVLPHRAQLAPVKAVRVGGYHFVNPLLICDLAEDQSYEGFNSLQHAIESAISTRKKNDDVTRASVYFRDMNYGTWTGVNVDDTYIPASLTKVPLYMAYLKASQTSPAVLEQTYSTPISTDANESESFKPAHPLLPGSYTVSELLQAMITGSDNNAELVLNEKVSTTIINDVYTTLDLPAGNENDENMSPKDYMVLFRVLYNATYIGRARSQAALELLSRTEFTQGIVAGVDGHTVSHKFGERSIYLQQPDGSLTLQKRELHDCGIVYYPGTPYGLCIMTEGTDFTRMANAVANISGLVYKSVEAGLLTNH